MGILTLPALAASLFLHPGQVSIENVTFPLLQLNAAVTFVPRCVCVCYDVLLYFFNFNFVPNC